MSPKKTLENCLNGDRPSRRERSLPTSRPLPIKPVCTGLLLDLDLGASLFEDLLDLLGFVLVHAFLDGLRSSLDQVLGFLQAQAGDRTDFLNHVDLLVAGIGEDHVEVGLLFGGSGSGGSATTDGSHGDRSGGGNAPLLFEQLGKLGRLEDG